MDYIVTSTYIKKYRCSCNNCGKDRGYQRKHLLDGICKSCEQEGSKRSKPAWNKGLKTGKPAWNRGEFFNNPIKQKLKNRMSRRMRHALSNKSLSKGWQHIFDIIGYSVNDLKNHLERRFVDGMTWDNIGKWHIDHIKPESLFNYSSFNDEVFKECWSLNNLQPLWAKDNIKKSNKYNGVYDGSSSK